MRWVLSGLMAAWLFALPAAAHRVSLPTTLIEWSDTTQSWQITHQISAHDLDKALQGQVNPLTVFETDAGLRQVGKYVTERFEFTTRQGEVTYIGAELEADYVFVYFEATGITGDVAIDNSLLMELPGTQNAVVTVRRGEEVKTLTFDAQTPPQVLSFLP